MFTRNSNTSTKTMMECKLLLMPFTKEAASLYAKPGKPKLHLSARSPLTSHYSRLSQAWRRTKPIRIISAVSNWFRRRTSHEFNSLNSIRLMWRTASEPSLLVYFIKIEHNFFFPTINTNWALYILYRTPCSLYCILLVRVKMNSHQSTIFIKYTTLDKMLVKAIQLPKQFLSENI